LLISFLDKQMESRMSQITHDDGPAIKKLDEREIELFDFVVKVVEVGCAFPTNEWILRETTLPIRLLPDLARRGYLRIILYNGQRRQVEICADQEAVRSTKKPRGAHTIIRIIDKNSPPVQSKSYQKS